MTEQHDPATSANKQKTILVVDDDPQILAYVSELLRDGGHNMLCAADGARALELARNHAGKIHLLLTDFEMPGMSGIQLAAEIISSRPTIKVLMMSGFSGGTLVLNEGWHFLPKPFVAAQLRAIVKGFLFPDNTKFPPS